MQPTAWTSITLSSKPRTVLIVHCGLTAASSNRAMSTKFATSPDMRRSALRVDVERLRLLAVQPGRRLLEKVHVAERDGQTVVEIVREHRGGLGAVGEQAVGALASDAGVDERALGARGRDHPAVQLRDRAGFSKTSSAPASKHALRISSPSSPLSTATHTAEPYSSLSRRTTTRPGVGISKSTSARSGGVFSASATAGAPSSAVMM